MVNFPSYMLAALEPYWGNLNVFVAEITAIKEDLLRVEPSDEVDYMNPYVEIGVLSFLSQRVSRYAERLDELVKIFNQEFPDRTMERRFVDRVERSMGFDLRNIQEVTEYWLHELPEVGPLDEITLVDAETEIAIGIGASMTDLHCVQEGSRVVGDNSLYEKIWTEIKDLSPPLQALMEKFARLKFDERRLMELRSRHPPSELFWWEYWKEELEFD